MTTALVSLALFLALPALAGWIGAGLRRNSAKRLCIFAKVRNGRRWGIQHMVCLILGMHKIGERWPGRDAWHGECF